MTADRDHILRDIAGKLPVTPNARKRQIWMVCIALGVISFVILLLTNPLRAWGSYAVNTIFFLGIAQGGVVLAARRSGSPTASGAGRSCGWASRCRRSCPTGSC
jgi:hypothetical protein